METAMNERIVTPSYFFGTPGADVVAHVEFPFPWTLIGIKAVQINDGSATLTVAGGATIAEAAIGDSGDPSYHEPTIPDEVAADTVVTLTIDYDGGSGTAGQGINLVVIALMGEG